VTIDALGQRRTLIAYDWGSDTFVLEKNILSAPRDRDPVLIVRKSVLMPGSEGFLFTLTSGNHSVALLPLMDGRLWNLGRVPPRRRSDLMQRFVVCANLVGDDIEISQRDVPTPRVVEADEWLRGLGWPLARVVLVDRIDATIEYYRRMGQEWRIKPLAWSRKEMELALRASQTRLHTDLRYFQSAKGVHFLTYPVFAQLAELARTRFDDFRECLSELAAVPEGDTLSLLRTPKCSGHHEVELFGLRPRQAELDMLPAIEELWAGVRDGLLDPAAAAAATGKLSAHYRRVLDDPALAEPQSATFIETLYRHITGAVYLGPPEDVIPAFDDRRTALPGATYHGGKPEVHPGADSRTRAILDYVRSLLSHGEVLEYINVYELRTDAGMALGKGPTREIVFKTSRRVLPRRLIEKRLAQAGTGYGSYMLSRVQGFQGLGVSFGDYHLLSRHDGRSGEVHFYVRERYPGDAFGSIPRQRYLKTGQHAPNEEDPAVVLAIAALMGSAAAQNLALKKYVSGTGSNHFGEKEIVEFGYDVRHMRELPLHVRLCSVRGTLGWPDSSWTEQNLRACFEFYVTSFARVMFAFWRQHAEAVALDDLAAAFLEGFAHTTGEMHWNYTVAREQFQLFAPDVRKSFAFSEKWRFALWALEEQQARIGSLREMFDRHLQALARDGTLRPCTAASAAGGGPAVPSASVSRPA
jgi:hypothetical protein